MDVEKLNTARLRLQLYDLMHDVARDTKRAFTRPIESKIVKVRGTIQKVLEVLWEDEDYK